MRVGSQAVGTLKPPPCDLKATSMRVESHLIATLKPPQCDPKAPTRLPQGLKTDDGRRTTDELKAWRGTTDYGPRTTEQRMQKEEC